MGVVGAHQRGPARRRIVLHNVIRRAGQLKGHCCRQGCLGTIQADELGGGHFPGDH